MIKTTETLIFHESYELCPYLRELQRASRRNAALKDREKRMKDELDMDFPEMTRVKAHIGRRKEQKSRDKWVSLATEYASEIAISGPVEKEAMRRYLQMARENVEAMDRRHKKDKKRKSRIENIALNEGIF